MACGTDDAERVLAAVVTERCVYLWFDSGSGVVGFACTALCRGDVCVLVSALTFAYSDIRPLSCACCGGRAVASVAVAILTSGVCGF